MLSTLGDIFSSFVKQVTDIFQNHKGKFLRLFSVKDNLNDQGNNVEVSEQNTNILQGGITNHMNNVEEIRILIDEESTIAMDFTTASWPAANKIVISYSSREYTTRLMEITLGITGQAAVSLLTYATTITTATTTSSSKSLRGLDFVVAANAVGFVATFLGLWFSQRSKKRMQVTASVAAGKIGATAAACAIIVAMGLFLPANAISMWIVGFVCLFPAAAVAFS